MKFFEFQAPFKIQGNRCHLRSEEELAMVDKKAADEIFKTLKKTVLDEYMKANGFAKYKTNAYVRKNKIAVLEYLDLQKERYGSKTFTVNFSIMPLYVPHDYIVTGFGDRLGTMIRNKDTWWDYADETAARVSFQNVKEAIDRFVMPWFEKYADEVYLKEELLRKKQHYLKKGLGIPYKCEEWISAFDHPEQWEQIILENIQKLKLPKKL